MTREEAMKIIKGEHLIGYNMFENRDNNEDELVILEKESEWIVYATDERASKVTGSEKIYDNEEEALFDFIKRLRADKILRRM